MLAALPGRAAVDRRRGAAAPAIEVGYDEGHAGGGFDDEPRLLHPPRGRTPVNDLDHDIPF